MDWEEMLSKKNGNLKGKQESVARHFLSGRDVFVVLPKGSEKSLRYMLLSIVLDRFRQLCKAHSLVIMVGV